MVDPKARFDTISIAMNALDGWWNMTMMTEYLQNLATSNTILGIFVHNVPYIRLPSNTIEISAI
jgi:hypothetical protein